MRKFAIIFFGMLVFLLPWTTGHAQDDAESQPAASLTISGEVLDPPITVEEAAWSVGKTPLELAELSSEAGPDPFRFTLVLGSTEDSRLLVRGLPTDLETGIYEITDVSNDPINGRVVAVDDRQEFAVTSRPVVGTLEVTEVTDGTFSGQVELSEDDPFSETNFVASGEFTAIPIPTITETCALTPDLADGSAAVSVEDNPAGIGSEAEDMAWVVEAYYDVTEADPAAEPRVRVYLGTLEENASIVSIKDLAPYTTPGTLEMIDDPFAEQPSVRVEVYADGYMDTGREAIGTLTIEESEEGRLVGTLEGNMLPGFSDEVEEGTLMGAVTVSFDLPLPEGGCIMGSEIDMEIDMEMEPDTETDDD